MDGARVVLVALQLRNIQEAIRKLKIEAVFSSCCCGTRTAVEYGIFGMHVQIEIQYPVAVGLVASAGTRDMRRQLNVPLLENPVASSSARLSLCGVLVG